MHTMTMIHKSKCYPVTLVSITKTLANNTLEVTWANPYNMTGVFILQVSVDGGNSYINVKELNSVTFTEIVYSAVLGTIPNGQSVLFRIATITEICGSLNSNTIQTTYNREPVVIYEDKGGYYLDHIQNTYKNWRVNMPLAFVNNIISENGTYKFDFKIDKNQNMNSQITTLFKLAVNMPSNFTFPTLTDPIPAASIHDLANIPQQIGTANVSITLNLNANSNLTVFFYQYNGGFMRIGVNVKVKITRL